MPEKQRGVTHVFGDSSLKYASQPDPISTHSRPVQTHYVNFGPGAEPEFQLSLCPKPKDWKWCHDNSSDLTKLLRRPLGDARQCFHRLWSRRSSLAANRFWHLKSSGFPVNFFVVRSDSPSWRQLLFISKNHGVFLFFFFFFLRSCSGFLYA